MNATLTLPGLVITFTLPETAETAPQRPLSAMEREELLQAREVFRRAREYDDNLNREEEAPTGDSYNDLFDLYRQESE